MSKGVNARAKRWAQMSDMQYIPRPIGPPLLAPGVVPPDPGEGYMALDSASCSAMYNYAGVAWRGRGFPGYPYLSDLLQISEYRAPAEITSKEMVRKWIKFVAVDDKNKSQSTKLKAIDTWFKKHHVKSIFERAAKHDCEFGRGQIGMRFKGDTSDNKQLPLMIDPRAIKQGSFLGLKNIEPVWTTPYAYNSIDPMADDFFKPSSWFVLGTRVDASRILTMISREMPDFLKPAYNFAGMSLTQLMEPYIDRWLSTARAVNRLIHNYSIVGIRTDMSTASMEGDDSNSGEQDLFDRADFFTAVKDNRGLMLLQNGDPNLQGEGEEMFQLNTPLSELSQLQAQAQEHQAAPCHIPLVKLFGITPNGLNASSEGEIRVFYDFIHSMQESIFSEPLDTLLKIAQLDLFGEIDDTIGYEFNSLFEPTGKELAEIRKSNFDGIVGLVGAAVVSAEEGRQALVDDPASGFDALDVDDIPELSGEGQEANEADGANE